jgi:CRP-like cAMP-binding protein
MVDLNVGAPSLEGTFLATLRPSIAAAMLAESKILERQPGLLVFDVTDPRPHVGMLLSGTTRSFLRAADGRQLTVRYSKRGAIVGKESDLSGDHASLSVEALEICQVLEFDPDRLRDLVAAEPTVAHAIVNELTRRLEDVYATVADAVFGSMQQRVVRHVLALARNSENGGNPVAGVTQQQLADGVGTSREVVGRALSRLRIEGLVRTSAREIEVLDGPRLASCLGVWRSGQRPAERSGVGQDPMARF